ncbi:methyltransferase [Chryseobacterium suipulveris]|uniref:Methyltransferase n=1 Tax=Chryseobacterium suipulveris TaxID=2929800 RepID=A0ABY4BN15_9FLAO|nr:methyltransferase [Chryseobacterium suipulveris]UOE40565.1 methyltransferase [Chryseobacterium suipulveris]
MKPFHFQQFTVRQSKAVFRVGTDAVLLGALCSVSGRNKMLEVGTGTGIISLMLAQRNLDAEILAIDINKDASELAEENFRESPFHERMKVSQADFKAFKPSEKFDLIISNPPYFEENSSSKDILARQQTELNFDSLIEKSSKLLTPNGTLSVIIPFESGSYFESKCLENNLKLHRKTSVYGIRNSSPKRAVLEFGFEEKIVAENSFTIEETPRKYSEEYLKLTENFHQFQK